MVKIAVLSTWFNEEVIAPFFLSHYGTWDEVRILLDEESSDGSLKICQKFPNVVVEPCKMTAGLHELEKVAMLEKAFHEMEGKFDWVAVLDSDEFIIPQPRLTTKEFLASQGGFECVYSCMFPVYRHFTDKALDPSKPIIPQRIHGGKARENEVKPNVLRPFKDLKLTIGCHTQAQKMMVSQQFFIGAHWADADPSISLSRRMQRRARFSKENLEKGWGNQHFNVTKESILKELLDHDNDPVIAELIGRE